MTTGKAIFLIVVLLVGSFIGLGYLFNQSMYQVDEIDTLKKQLAERQMTLETLEKTHETDQNTIDELENQVKNLQEKVVEGNNVPAPTTANCNAATLSKYPNNPFSQGTSGNLLFASSLICLIAGSSIYRIYIGRKKGTKRDPGKGTNNQIRPKTDPIEDTKLVAIPMTREELQRYIRFQCELIKMSKGGNSL